jgi:hypothetical protein
MSALGSFAAWLACPKADLRPLLPKSGQSRTSYTRPLSGKSVMRRKLPSTVVLGFIHSI